MAPIHLDIVTPQKLAYSQDVDFVSVPTPMGTTGVLPRHTDLVTMLEEGEIKVKAKGQEMYFAIGGGFMEVTRKRILILVSRAFHAEELNESEIKKAQMAAKEVLAQKGKAADYAQAQAILRRSTIELHVLRRKKSRSSAILSSN